MGDEGAGLEGTTSTLSLHTWPRDPTPLAKERPPLRGLGATQDDFPFCPFLFLPPSPPLPPFLGSCQQLSRDATARAL